MNSLIKTSLLCLDPISFHQDSIDHEQARKRLEEDEVMKKALKILHLQEFRPYMMNENLQTLAKVLLCLLLVYRPKGDILNFEMVMIGLDKLAPELYCDLLESETYKGLTNDVARQTFKFTAISKILTLAVMSDQRMPICWNRREQTVDMKGMMGSYRIRMELVNDSLS